MNNNREQRISLSDEGIMIFYETIDGFFHGHIRSWIDLKVSGKIGRKHIDTLQQNGLVEKAKEYK